MSRLVHLVLCAVLLAALAAAHPTPDEEAQLPVIAEVEDEVKELEVAATEEVTEDEEPTTDTPAAAVSTTQSSSSSGFGNVITNGISHINETVRNETPCLKSGGTCLPQIECPAGNLSAEKGLCPNQQSLGVECCHGLSLLETRCKNRGGECTVATSCTRALVEDRAEDCPDDRVCCVLVRF